MQCEMQALTFERGLMELLEPGQGARSGSVRTGPGRPLLRAGADPAAAPSPSTGLRGQTLSPSLSNYCLLKKKDHLVIVFL